VLKDFGSVGDVSQDMFKDAPRTSYASIESLCTTGGVLN
jgi:hypothetical protein